MDFDTFLPVLFWLLMGVSMLAYVVLDGYDLGVGMLLPLADSSQDRDLMIASIGPFWDANETWLVLGVGLLLIAFPKAHGVILGTLYLPVSVMLLGLILRGVSFDFRAKAHAQHQPMWNTLFFVGSVMAAVSQGWMLGHYVSGLADTPRAYLLAMCVAVALPATYALLGACWLILKTDGALQARAVGWAKGAWPGMVLGLALISLATPLVSETVRERWFSFPAILALLPVPLSCAAALLAMRKLLNSQKIVAPASAWSGLPLLLAIGVMVMGALGMAYSLYPYVLLDRLTVWEVASAPSSLKLILAGCAISLPAIVGYTVFVYRVFGGKARPLSYG